MKKIIPFITFLTLLMLFAACDNLVNRIQNEESLNEESLPEGYGKVSITMGAAGARTIFPSKTFDHYVYTFTGEDGTPRELTPENGNFELEAGDWTVQVKAYLGEVSAENLAAEGSGTFTLADNEVKQVAVTLDFVKTSGSGTFKYDIRYTSGTTVNSFTVKKLPELTESLTLNPAGSTGVSGTVTDVPSGFYLLNLQLTQDGLATGTTEVICISPGLITEYGTDREPVIISNSYFAPAEEGIYIGIIKFAGDATNITGSPVLLNREGRSKLINYLDNDYTIAGQSGTALYYGLHQGLANLKSTEAAYPRNLDSVNIITFTDGLDISSAARSRNSPIEGQKFDTGPSYGTYLKEEIQQRSIAGKPITAYSVGVRGSDITDIPGFQTALENLASPGKANELSNFENVQAAFSEITDSLNVVVNTNTSFNLTIPEFDNGTKVRITFDAISGTDSESAQNAVRYLEGIISITGNTTTLTDIRYGGDISAKEGSGPITGTLNGTEITFPFTNLIGYKPEDGNNIKQWYMLSGSSAWQINTEYDSGGAVSNKLESRSTYIYLVLDCSTSLNGTQITQIRDAAKTFINDLYLTVPLVNSSWVNGNITHAGEEHEYSFPVTAGTTYRVWLNDRSQGDYTKTADVSITAMQSNGSSSYFYQQPDAWSMPASFTADTNGTVIVMVSSYGGGTGTYAIAYNASSTRPQYITPTWPITGDVWVNGKISTDQTDRYSLEVTEGQKYYFWLNDKGQGDNTKTADVSITAGLSGSSISSIGYFPSHDSAWITPASFTATEDGRVDVSVSGGTGTYAILYSTSRIKPGIPELTADNWISGNITTSGQIDEYIFDVEAGTPYYLWWNDSGQGDGSQTGNVMVSAQYSDETSIFSSNNGWATTENIFTPAVAGTVIVRVQLYDNSTSYTGTYAITYNTSPIKPGTPELSADNWTPGNITTSGQIDEYIFDVEADTKYYLWWNSSYYGDDSQSGYVEVSAQYSDGTSIIFSDSYNGWTTENTFTPAVAGTVIVRVRNNYLDFGTYALCYSTGSTRPAVVN